MSQSRYVDTEYFGMPVGTKVSPLGGGRNSQVFLLEPPGREPLVFKRYFVDPRDKRDRQGTEARALRFFEQAGIRDAPLLLAMASDRQASMMTYVAGEKLDRVTQGDIERAAAFLVRLVRLSRSPEAVGAGFDPASEAFFSAAEVVENIRMRVARLDAARGDCPQNVQLAEFLDTELVPAFNRHILSCEERLRSAGMRMDQAIPEAWRILSPSDFGTHNALRRPDGGLSFFDYEYFGWDDPSKTLADFCLHPAMTLAKDQQAAFLASVLPALRETGYKHERAEAMFPLFGIKWCCILLNEFVPKDQARRSFAGCDVSAGRDAVLRRQMAKACRMLAGLDESSRIFSGILNASGKMPSS